jgi:exopolysaccharide biosynthesis polyprenyl glycosylphosphotransferase
MSEHARALTVDASTLQEAAATIRPPRTPRRAAARRPERAGVRPASGHRDLSTQAGSQPKHRPAAPTPRALLRIAARRRGLAPAIPEIRGPAACLKRDTLFRRSLLAADLAALTGAIALTLSLSRRPLQVTWELALAIPILIVCAKLSGLYDRDQALLRKTTLDEAPKLAQLATLYALLAWLTSATMAGGLLAADEVLLLWAGLTALLVLARSGSRALALRIAPTERCLVIGDEHSTRVIRAKLTDGGGVKAELVAHIDLDKVEPWSTDSFSGSRLAEIGRLARTLDVHRAIIAPRSADAGETLNLIRTLNAVGVRISVLPRLLEVVGSSVEFDDVHGLTVMGVARFELTRSSAAVKRSFDLASVAVGLLFLAPLLAVIAVAITLDGGGSVLFRQLRVGRHGKPFQIYKFRTMVADAEAQKASLQGRNEAQAGLFKILEDPRVTRVGRFLRRSALDELPQLLNVLRGEMSLVGPRPLVLDEDRHVAGWHRRRLTLTPGMTGQWQILGPARVPLGEMVAIDYLYVANWSLWTDIKILLRTASYVLARRGR